MLAEYCYAVRRGIKVQLVTPYRVSHLQRYDITVCGNVTSVYPPLVFTYVLKEYISFISRVEGSKKNAKHGERVHMYRSVCSVDESSETWWASLYFFLAITSWTSRPIYLCLSHTGHSSWTPKPLKMKSVCSSETSWNTNPVTQCHALNKTTVVNSNALKYRWFTGIIIINPFSLAKTEIVTHTGNGNSLLLPSVSDAVSFVPTLRRWHVPGMMWSPSDRTWNAASVHRPSTFVSNFCRQQHRCR